MKIHNTLNDYESLACCRTKQILTCIPPDAFTKHSQELTKRVVRDDFERFETAGRGRFEVSTTQKSQSSSSVAMVLPMT